MACIQYVEMPRKYSPGLTGGPSFSTIKVVSQTGQEQRIRQWVKGRWKFDASQLLRKREQAEELLSLFLALGGSQCGFLFYDWSDHSSKLNNVETPHLALELTSTTFQMQKIYSIGGLAYLRAIKNPIADTFGDMAATAANSTVRVFDGSLEAVAAGWEVDCRTGILTFDVAPGYTPSTTFEFHVPVRLDSDDFAMTMNNPGQFNWPKINLVELR